MKLPFSLGKEGFQYPVLGSKYREEDKTEVVSMCSH